ncbi:putative membrane protein [Rickettsia parkeri str. Tate's Hell]|uniref:Membrane protein n=1 Tax=Rickettsia parkeri str. Tate's Hell TaxID=1359189 RepID=A0ABR5DQH5_RICPA|nr:putative membrane protein [Rickettsia parkeri str. AT\
MLIFSIFLLFLWSATLLSIAQKVIAAWISFSVVFGYRGQTTV